MFTLSNEADYALLLVSELRKYQEFVPLSTVIKSTHLPPRFFARIASKLAKEGLLESKEGKIGGYRLQKDWETKSVYDFLKIFDNTISLVKCESAEFKCVFEDICEHKTGLGHKVSSLVTDTLKQHTLATLFEKKPLL